MNISDAITNNRLKTIPLDELIDLLALDDDSDNDAEQWAGNLQLEESINRERISECHDDEENLLKDDDGSELVFE